MFYFIITDQLHYKRAFSDIDPKDTLVCVTKRDAVLKKIQKYHLLPKTVIHKLVCHALEAKLTSEDTIVITDTAFRKLPNGWLNRMRQKYPGLKSVLLLYNKVSLLYNLPGNTQMTELPNRDTILPFDRIFSYDLDDIANLGFEYFEVYSKPVIQSDIKQTNTTYYCGAITQAWKMDRFQEVDSVYRYLTENGVPCDFKLVLNKGMDDLPVSYTTRNRVPYDRIIEDIQSSNVILEIVSDGKYGATFRYCEAITCNRKLLTNNFQIKNLPYYNPKYMRIFSDVRDIDLEWCKEVETVDYGYQDDFSPRAFKELLLS